MIDSRSNAQLGDVLAQLTEVDCGLLLFDSRERSLDLQLESLRSELEQMSQLLAGKLAQDHTGTQPSGKNRNVGGTRDATACKYRELLDEFEEKREVARCSRMVMARERRVLEIRRRRLVATIPPEVVAAYARLQKRVPA
jgi:hypothetical protein